jgi:hypothetical protein
MVQEDDELMTFRRPAGPMLLAILALPQLQ